MGKRTVYDCDKCKAKDVGNCTLFGTHQAVNNG